MTERGKVCQEVLEALGPDLFQLRGSPDCNLLIDARTRRVSVSRISHGSVHAAGQQSFFDSDSLDPREGLLALLRTRASSIDSAQSIILRAVRAYARSDASVRGHRGLQCLLEHLMRSAVLFACRDRPKRNLGERGSDHVRIARHAYREFAKKAMDAGLAADLPSHAREWLAASLVERSCRSEAGNSARSASELVSLLDLLRMQPDMCRLLQRCQSELNERQSDPDSAASDPLDDDVISSIHWDLVMCEAWCREILARLRGDPMAPLEQSCEQTEEEQKPEEEQKRARLLDLPPRSQIVDFWRCMRLLLQLRLRLWRCPIAPEALQREMAIVGIRHPRDGAVMATRFYCDALSGGGERSDSRSLRREFVRLLGDQSRLWPFDGGRDWDGLERACARWFDRRPERILEDWREDCRQDLERSQPSGSGGGGSRISEYALVRLCKRSLSKYPVTALSLSVTLLMLWSMRSGDTGFVTPRGVQEPLAYWPHGCYVVAQLLLLAAWVFRRESRRFLPRSFYGTCFVWLISLLPLVEVIRKVELIPAMKGEGVEASPAIPRLVLDFIARVLGSGMPENSGLDRLAHPQPGGHSQLVLTGATLGGFLVTFGLILLQIRGRRITRPDLQRRSPQLVRAVREFLVSLRDDCGDLLIAGKVVLMAWCGSMWWGTVMFSALACFRLWPDGVTVFGSLFPLSIWAVAIAFISQLMWQDQFLTEPMSHDR